ncbi:MAG: response regulator [Sandaracinaceae bacterium]|nr:response regulator [Sandaracinaceae bacterium]
MSDSPDGLPRARAILIDRDEVDRARVRDLGASLQLLATIDEAATPSEAIARLEASPYDVVLIDLQACGETGVQVIAHLRERWPALPCVLLTAADDPQTVRAAMRAGAVDYVSKADLAASRLEQAIRLALRVGGVERALAATRGALERQVGLLGSLVEIGARVHHTACAEDAVSIGVRAASALFGARVALDLTVAGRRFDGAHDPFSPETGPLEWHMLVPVAVPETAPIGELRCERLGQPFERAEELAAIQLARTVAVAIEKHALLAAARDRAREREEIVAVVSHDLRAPLQTFAFAMEALRGAGSRAVIDDILDRVGRTMRQMWRLLDDLLDVSRLHEGKLVVHPQPVSAVRVLSQVVEQMRGHAQQREVTLRAAVPSPDLRVLADEQRLHQALDNLVGNAIRYARSAVTLRVIEEKDSVRFDVVDDGPGVDRALRAKLFDRLFQGPGAGRGELGLGLFIVSGIARAHGGTVGMDEVPGGGADFWIRLPRA